MKSAALILLLMLPQLAMSQTDVTGSQSGTWTSVNSPYHVIGEITVPTGQVLNIEPGVEVNFQGHYKLTVNGGLNAVGAENDSIFFTTDNQAVGWGGIRIDSSVISNLSYCRIEFGKTVGDYPDAHGGALALFGSDAVVTHCVFADNEATGSNMGMGGAVYGSGTGSMSGPLTYFIDCRFIRNHAYGEGGAIKFTGDMNTEIIRCEFFENDCFYGGGAVSCYGVYDTKLIDSVFADNYTMYSNGGAVNTLGFGNTVFFTNCTFTNNTAVTGDGGAVNLAYASAYFVNTIVYQNNGMYSDDVYVDFMSTAEIYYSNLPMPGGATGHHNINANPQFADVANRDFNLLETSPSVDTGIAYFVAGGVTMVDLDPSEYVGPAPDMGAFEFSPVSGVLDGATTLVSLYQNYPNPFSSNTAISFRLTQDSPVSVKVYNVKGQEVRTLAQGIRAAGLHSLAWDGRNNTGRTASTGTYFVRLQAGNEVSSMRMLLSY